MRIAWDSELTGHIANATSFTFGGRSAFLYYCQHWGYNVTTEGIKLFQALGVDIRDRDDRGFTCLHICLGGSGPVRELHEDFNAVKFLVDSGADPSAKTDYGMSVGEFAYPLRECNGSYVGELWDAVLQKCGFDISHFRLKCYRRYAKYTKYYSRPDFEALWEGRESECPYWDDEPWPPLEPGEVGYNYESCCEDGSDRVDFKDDESYSKAKILSAELREWEGTMEFSGRTQSYQGWKKCHSLEDMKEDTSGDSESEGNRQESPGMEPHCEEQSNQEDIAYQQADAGGEMPRFSLLSDMELDNPWID